VAKSTSTGTLFVSSSILISGLGIFTELEILHSLELCKSLNTKWAELSLRSKELMVLLQKTSSEEALPGQRRDQIRHRVHIGAA
jgi:hypothetical protein